MSLTRSSAVKDRASSSAKSYQGSDKLVFGIVLAVVTFWLFAQTTLNIASTMRADLRISESLNNISVSITALFSGIFIVVAGKLADRVGRVKMTYFGLALQHFGVTADCDFTCRHCSLLNGRTHHSRSLSRVHNAGDASPVEGVLRWRGPSARNQFLVDRFVGRLGSLLTFRRLGRFLAWLALDFLDVDRCGGREFSADQGHS